MKFTVAAIVCLLLVLPSVVTGQGLEPEDASEIASFPKAAMDRGVVLQPRVILQGIPAPGDQWRTSTCTAWAVAYAAGSYFHRTRLNGPGMALSPAFTYALGNGDSRCLAMSRMSKMLDALRDVGGLPLSEYAFDPGWCGRVPTDAERRRAAAFRVPGWAIVSANDPGAAKAQLAAGRVVIFSMGVGPAFNAHRGKAVFDVLEPVADIYGHAMVAVGYDDAMQAFRIQNSFGSRWGDDGQAWLSYRVWRERAETVYVITDPPVPTQTSAVDAGSTKPSMTTLERFKAALPAGFASKPGLLDEGLRQYLAEKPHRALALSLPNGTTWRQSDWSKPEDARQMVMEKCQMFYGHPCVLFAEDDEPRRLAPGHDWEPQDMPRLHYSGPYDPLQIPGLSSSSRELPAIATYGKASEPKAMAVHPWGSAFVSTGASSPREGEAEALRRCNADPVRNGRDGPCYLYATGNRVVLLLRKTQPVTP